MARNYPEIRFGDYPGHDSQSLFFFPGISTAAAIAVHLTQDDETALLSLLLQRSRHAGPSADREENPDGIVHEGHRQQR